MHVCMFRFAWGLTRLARRARGGLFALRVTRRGHWVIGGLEAGGWELGSLENQSHDDYDVMM